MIKVKCPKRNVEYNVYKVEPKMVNCMDCGEVYHQGFNNSNIDLWISEMVVKLSKTLNFWKKG